MEAMSALVLIWFAKSAMLGLRSTSGTASRAATARIAERRSSSCFSNSCFTDPAFTCRRRVTAVRRGTHLMLIHKNSRTSSPSMQLSSRVYMHSNAALRTSRPSSTTLSHQVPGSLLRTLAVLEEQRPDGLNVGGETGGWTGTEREEKEEEEEEEEENSVTDEERAATQRETERYDCLWIRGEEEEEEEGRWNGSTRQLAQDRFQRGGFDVCSLMRDDRGETGQRPELQNSLVLSEERSQN
ncbi:hypothetical protein F7725_016446 [Dissostichus mawsoni]|uniref:Uncharacterized protein n=1 Tax=Dissostichus mawsoni TaxID=36200 RepID=A0A7J5Z2I9_DISMA|nr:hypothetical protein F7725_016446 [Dissostichus mawsoni]